MENIRSKLDLLKECEVSSKEVLAMKGSDRVLNLTLPHAINTFCVTDMNEFLQCRNEIQEAKTERFFSGLLKSRKRTNKESQASGSWLCSKEPRPKKAKYQPVLPSKRKDSPEMLVEDINDDDESVSIIPESHVESPIEVKDGIMEDKQCQVGSELFVYE